MRKLLLVALVIAGMMDFSTAQARMVATKAQCVAACDGNGSVGDNCSGITKRAKFKRCRSKLILRCRKFGVDSMCPEPPPPTTTTTVPAPVVTTTTSPALTTTSTTTETTSTTTTTTVPDVPNLIGPYTFDGHVTDDHVCGILGVGTPYSLDFAVTGQSGHSLSGTVEGVPARYGEVYTNGDWYLTVSDGHNLPGCTEGFYLQVFPSANGSTGELMYSRDCGTLCPVIIHGTVN